MDGVEYFGVVVSFRILRKVMDVTQHYGLFPVWWMWDRVVDVLLPELDGRG